jgi:hypothetical protein
MAALPQRVGLLRGYAGLDAQVPASKHAGWTAALPRWKTATVAAREQTLETLVKDELPG